MSDNRRRPPVFRSVLLDETFSWTHDSADAADAQRFAHMPGLHGFMNGRGDFHVCSVSGGCTPMKPGPRAEDWSMYT